MPFIKSKLLKKLSLETLPIVVVTDSDDREEPSLFKSMRRKLSNESSKQGFNFNSL
jgi:hypothetical protein